MPERKKPSLSEILEAFTKEASIDTMPEAPAPIVEEAMPQVAPVVPTDPQHPIVSAAKHVVEAASNVTMDQESLERAAKNMQQDTQKLEGAAEALKAIAKTASETHEENMYKEASLFGEIFAKAVISEFEKNASVKEAQEAAYTFTLEKVAEEEMQSELIKVAEEAYTMCLQKLAFDEGYGSVPQMPGGGEQQVPGGTPMPQVPADPNSPFIPQVEPEVAPEVAPEPVVEAAAPAVESTVDGDLLYGATEAVKDSAQAARSAAEAAKEAVKAAVGAPPSEPEIPAEVVAPELEPEPTADPKDVEAEAEAEGEEVPEEVAEKLPKVAHESYMATMDYLNKTASEGHNLTTEELDALLTKVAQEAYDLVVGGE